MSTASASYRNSQTAQPVTQAIDPGELLRLSQDLESLCEMGILEACVDRYGFVRYRPSGKAA